MTLSKKHFSSFFQQLHERERKVKKREFLQFNSPPSPQLQGRHIRQNDLSTVPLVSSLPVPFPSCFGRIFIFSYPITATAPILQRRSTSSTSSRYSLSRSSKDSYQGSSEDSQQCSRRHQTSWIELREEQAGSNCARRP